MPKQAFNLSSDVGGKLMVEHRVDRYRRVSPGADLGRVKIGKEWACLKPKTRLLWCKPRVLRHSTKVHVMLTNILSAGSSARYLLGGQLDCSYSQQSLNVHVHAQRSRFRTTGSC